MADIQHKPLQLRDLPPEKVFAREWEALASALIDLDDLEHDDLNVTRGQAIAAGHNRMLEIGQEEATLAATFITWLGTNVGGCFLGKGRRMEEELSGRHLAGMGFLAAWAIHNARHIGRNSGWRSCEYLAWDGDWKDARRFNPPAMTEDELEVLENMARWLGTSEGGKFLARCEALIYAEQKGLSVHDLSHLAAATPAKEKTNG